jgi:hypothetical protein
MVALVNPAYLHVLGGNIGVTTGAGFGSFGPPTYIQVLGPNALPITIPVGQLPPNVAALFNQLGALTFAPGAGVGADGATAAAAGTFNPAWLIVPIVIGGALAGSGGGDGGGTTGTTKP